MEFMTAFQHHFFIEVAMRPDSNITAQDVRLSDSISNSEGGFKYSIILIVTTLDKKSF